MFKRSLFTAALALCSTLTLFAQNIAVGEWRSHLPYQDIYQVADGNGVVFAASEYGIYTVDKQDGSVEILSKASGLSDVGIKVMKYSAADDVLVIVYNNLNIDLIKNGNLIVNIKDILRFTVSGLKEANDIYFNNGDAYISTSFGVVVIDLEKEETKESYLNIGNAGAQINVNSVTHYGDSIYIATNSGIRAAQKDRLLSDFNNWRDAHTSLKTTRLVSFGNSLYADVDSSLRVYNGTSWSFYDGTEKIATTTLEVYYDKLVIAQSSSTNKQGGIYIQDINGTKTTKDANIVNDVVVVANGDIWYGTVISGLLLHKTNGEIFYITPNGPPTVTSFDMLSVGDQLWVTAGGYESTLFSPIFNNGGFFNYTDGKWSDSPKNPELLGVRDYTFIARNPKNGHLFFASHVNGLIEYYNGQVIKIYDHTNSPLKQFTTLWVTIGGIEFDDDGNLWMTNYNANDNDALHMLSEDGDWFTFKAPNPAIMQLIIDDFDQKWMVVRRGGGVGIAVFTDNGEPDNPNVHEWKLLNTFPGNGGLPTVDVTYLAKDKDGEIWVGTNEGIAVFFNPGNVFTNRNFDASRIIITDGEFANYLLGNEVINTIVVDGGNRKWVGTNSGVWLLSPDGTETIHQFNTDNSPLPSNNVVSIGINEKTGEVFFGTDYGIMSYRGDATEADDTHGDVTVFPNPVRPDYQGLITITGLPTDAYVKITDISGNLVYETIANGGTATWNGLNFNGQRPQTGIYLVFTSNEDGDDTNVAKILFVN